MSEPATFGPFKYLERCWPQYKDQAVARLKVLISAYQGAEHALSSAEDVIDLVSGRLQAFDNTEVAKFEQGLMVILSDLGRMRTAVEGAWLALLSELEERYNLNQCALAPPLATGAEWLSVFKNVTSRANDYTRIMKARYVGQLELAASITLKTMEQSRILLGDPLLWGDPILVEIEQDLAGLETSVVQAQSLVTIETESLGTEGIQSITSGFVAMLAIDGRAHEILEKLRNRLVQIKEEGARQEDLKKQQVLEVVRQSRQEEGRRVAVEADALSQQKEGERLARMTLAERIREVEAEINRERALLLRAKYDLELARTQAAERETRDAVLWAQRAGSGIA
jgi:hypothetical protein